MSGGIECQYNTILIDMIDTITQEKLSTPNKIEFWLFIETICFDYIVYHGVIETICFDYIAHGGTRFQTRMFITYGVSETAKCTVPSKNLLHV